MTTYSTRLDVTSAISTPMMCPACGNDNLITVTLADRTAFRCTACSRMWYLAMGRARLDLHPLSA